MQYETKFLLDRGSLEGKEPGFIELTDDDQVIFYKKRKWVRVLFGILGSMMDSGKEVLRFDIVDIDSFGEIESSKKKNDFRIVLKNGKYVELIAGPEIREALKAKAKVPMGLPVVQKEVSKDPEEKIMPFLCKNCGNSFTGWYKTCPNCKAVNTIERVK
ncbi:MAG: hypothetical protein SPE18_03060 [Candidatus Limivicinus sp.]|nr:hypothetical protein [Candidatus Limivicinus sp.]